MNLNNINPKKLPTTKADKRWLKVGIAGVIATAIIIPTSFATARDAPKPTPTATAAKVLPSVTPNEKETVATGTAKSVASLVADNVASQLTEEQIKLITDSSVTSEADPAGTAAKIYFVTFDNIPATLDYQANMDSVIAYLKTQNKDANTDWNYTKAEPSDLEGSTVIGALKTWDASKKPTNPSIIEISYSKIAAKDKTPETIEITISATVY